MPDTSHALLGYQHYHQMLGGFVWMEAFSEAVFSPAFDLFFKKIMVEQVVAEKLLIDPVSMGVIDLRTVDGVHLEGCDFHQ